MCWYEPPEASKKLIKNNCELIVAEIKRLEKEGDPVGISISSTKQLLDHLYTGKCHEKDAWIWDNHSGKDTNNGVCVQVIQEGKIPHEDADD